MMPDNNEILEKMGQLSQSLGECVSQATSIKVQISHEPGIREVSLVHTKLQEAEDWARRALAIREGVAGETVKQPIEGPGNEKA